MQNGSAPLGLFAELERASIPFYTRLAPAISLLFAAVRVSKAINASHAGYFRKLKKKIGLRLLTRTFSMNELYNSRVQPQPRLLYHMRCAHWSGGILCFYTTEGSLKREAFEHIFRK